LQHTEVLGSCNLRNAGETAFDTGCVTLSPITAIVWTHFSLRPMPLADLQALNLKCMTLAAGFYVLLLVQKNQKDTDNR
jgi:hypothetical protein